MFISLKFSGFISSNHIVQFVPLIYFLLFCDKIILKSPFLSTFILYLKTRVLMACNFSASLMQLCDQLLLVKVILTLGDIVLVLRNVLFMQNEVELLYIRLSIYAHLHKNQKLNLIKAYTINEV